MVLKAKQIEHAKPGMHADGNGLYLRVQPGGAKSWIFRFQVNKRRREMGLGTLEAKPAPEARVEAALLAAQVLQGVDPIDARQKSIQAAQAAKVPTFNAAAEQFIEAHRVGWRNSKHAAQWQNTLDKYVSPVFGDQPVDAVDLPLVLQVLEPIWQSKTETASRVRGRIENILDWATVNEFRTGANPARWKGHLEHLMKSRKEMATAGHRAARVRHHPALPYKQINAFMTELRDIPGAGARALEFAILTAARSGEVRGALWSEIDFVHRMWNIPATRMKASRDHSVPLSPAAVNLLQRLRQGGPDDFVFLGERGSKVSERGIRPISDMTITAVIRRMNAGEAGARWIDPQIGSAQVVPHGFRSTFRDWAAEETEFANELVEMALAHAVGNKVEAAYRRGTLFERRRKLMDAWGVYCYPDPGEAAASQADVVTGSS